MGDGSRIRDSHRGLGLAQHSANQDQKGNTKSRFTAPQVRKNIEKRSNKPGAGDQEQDLLQQLQGRVLPRSLSQGQSHCVASTIVGHVQFLQLFVAVQLGSQQLQSLVSKVSVQ